MSEFLASIQSVVQMVQDSETSTALRESQYVWSLFEVAHVVSMCLFAGLIVMMDLRLLGVGNMQTPFSQLQKRLFPWQMLGMKMRLMVIAALNALAFHYISYFSVDTWDGNKVPPFGAKLAGALGILLWGFVIVSGRLIPYNWFQNN